MFLPVGSVGYRGRFVVVTIYVHSAVSVAVRFGLGPLNMSRRRHNDLFPSCRLWHSQRRTGSSTSLSLFYVYRQLFQRSVSCINVYSGVGSGYMWHKYVFKQMKNIHKIWFSTTSCQLETSKHLLFFLVYTPCNINILNKSVGTSNTTICIGIKITQETWIAQQFIATYVRKS